MSASPAVYVLHENPEWFAPIERAFSAEGVPVRDWLLTGGAIDLSAAPPEGVFWSRISASAHTRGNERTKEYARAVLSWLESWGRTVVNGSSVIELEVSKVAQYAKLRAAGIEVPRTSAVFGTAELLETAREYPAPFIVKHNQGGKGLGVRRFDSHEEFERHVASPEFEPSPDGITLVQEYLPAQEPFITRVEFVGGEYLYAVRVDTSSGSFELCPAEACELPAFVPAGAACEVPAPGAATSTATQAPPQFQLRPEVDGYPILDLYRNFLRENGVTVAGIEFIETVDGRLVTYDINTNTNYNPAVEESSPRSGARENARYFGRLLEESGE
ncbi:MAG: ATP-grasp domain-containing protein [Leucobacter sp.]